MLEPEVSALVAVAVALATGDDSRVEAALDHAYQVAPHGAVEEVLLQSVLFLGYPVALDGFRRWRGRRPEPVAGGETGPAPDTFDRGVGVFSRIYGRQAARVRENVRALHPALERWMVEEGYGRVLGRPGLDLVLRELAIVGQLSVAGPSPQLHSHLRGALRAGARPDQVEAAFRLAAAGGGHDPRGVESLWSDVQARMSTEEAGSSAGTTPTERRESGGAPDLQREG